MKTKKKLLIALLSATCLAAGAFGLAACKTEKGAQGDAGPQGPAGSAGIAGTAGKSAYELYCDSVPAGQTPLTEAEWLASLVGTNGAEGNGIASIELSPDGLNIVINYTDGSAPTYLPLPDAVTHEHTYGRLPTTVLAPTEDTEGLGYKTCTGVGCDHKELVVLPREITLNSTGVFMDEHEVNLNEKISTVGDKITYKVKATKEASTWEEQSVSFAVPSEEGDYNLFNVTINCNYVYKEVDYQPAYEFEMLAYLTEEAIEEYETNYYFELTVDVDSMPAALRQQNQFEFTVTFERLPSPEQGSVYVPFNLPLDTTISKTTAANKELYFITDELLSGRYQFEFGDNVTLTYLTASLDNTPQPVTNGQIMSLGYSKFYFKASATDGNVSFKMSPYYDDGEQGKPIVLTKDVVVNAEENMWYSFTATEGQRLTVETTSGDAGIEIYDDNSSAWVQSIGHSDLNIYGFEFENEGTYYIKATADFSFKVRDYVAATDEGTSFTVAKALTAGSAESVNSETTKYYKYVATQNGMLYLTAQGLTVMVYDNTNPESRSELFSASSDAPCMEVSEGDTLYFEVYAGEGSFKVAYGNTTAQVTHTVNLVGVEGGAIGDLTGVTVIAKKNQGTTSDPDWVEVARATVAADNKVDLNMVPGVYSVYLENLPAGYTYTVPGESRAKIPMSFENCEASVEIAVNEQYTVTVVGADSQPVAGIDVMLNSTDSGNSDPVTTNVNGEAVFSIAPYGYEIVIDSEDYELSQRYFFIQYGTDRTIVVTVQPKAPEVVYENVTVGSGMTINAETSFKFTSVAGMNNISVTGGYIKALSTRDGAVITDGVCSPVYAINTTISGANIIGYDCEDWWGDAEITFTIVPDGASATVTVTLTPDE